MVEPLSLRFIYQLLLDNVTMGRFIFKDRNGASSTSRSTGKNNETAGPISIELSRKVHQAQKEERLTATAPTNQNFLLLQCFLACYHCSLRNSVQDLLYRKTHCTSCNYSY
jgi:hypothetical protein